MSSPPCDTSEQVGNPHIEAAELRQGVGCQFGVCQTQTESVRCTAGVLSVIVYLFVLPRTYMTITLSLMPPVVK